MKLYSLGCIELQSMHVVAAINHQLGPIRIRSLHLVTFYTTSEKRWVRSAEITSSICR